MRCFNCGYGAFELRGSVQIFVTYVPGQDCYGFDWTDGPEVFCIACGEEVIEGVFKIISDAI